MNYIAIWGNIVTITLYTTYNTHTDNFVIFDLNSGGSL